MKHRTILIAALLIAVLLAACSAPPPSRLEGQTEEAASSTAPPTDVPTLEPTVDTTQVAQGVANVEYTLMTSSEQGLAFVGVGGDINGVVNPQLTAQPGDTVKITVINGDGVLHDLTIDEFNVATGELQEKDTQASIVFTVDEVGEYVYFCSIPGHRQAGMWGTLVVGEPEPVATTGENIVRHPTDLPGPLAAREPETVVVDLTAQEVEGQLAEGTTFTYFTFNGKIPGPFIRVRVGDTVQINLTNDTSSTLSHSIDLHAVNGPGGGAVYTQVAPGEDKTFTFKALNPGLYVYHCATPSVPHHIQGGMYGLILVEPEDGLPPVDREFYVMQGEIYTLQPFGTQGHLDFSHEAMLDEDASYVVFNGAAGALTLNDNALKANVGQTVRIFFGVGGPNYTSSFHVIGEIFDRVYPFASITSEPLTNVQTVTVPPGGAWIVEFKVDVPGTYILVDHALSRLERGLVGYLIVEGPDDPTIFKDGPAE